VPVRLFPEESRTEPFLTFAVSSVQLPTIPVEGGGGVELEIVNAAEEMALSFNPLDTALALTIKLLVKLSGAEYFVEAVVGLLPSVVK
jgi:hypothetical protein